MAEHGNVGTWVAVLAAVAVAGCSGAIEDGAASTGSGGSVGASDGTGGQAGGSGTTGASGAGGGVAAPSDPGRVTLHRLNRAEYTNTVRDLLGSTLRPADDFPADDRGYGYDNIADVLSLSPVQIEMYFNAAQALIDDAMAVSQVGAHRYEAEAMEATLGSVFRDTAWLLNSAGSVQQTLTIDTAGDYRVAVRAWQDQAGTDPARMTIDINGAAVQMFDVTALEAAPAVYELEVHLDAGTATVAATFTNDYYVASPMADRNLLVDWVEVQGPLGVTSDNPRRAQIMVCEPDAADPGPCLRTVAAAFGRRAFRRPLQSREVDALVALPLAAIAAGDDVESATRLMLRAVLVSPNFVFRVETDPDPASPAAHALNDHELASRLSYFLWSSMPDDVLLDLADQGKLHEPATLRAQVTRMLADKKADALVSNFAGQWLFTRSLDDREPDYTLFPEFDEELRGAMRNETELYFREFLFGNEGMDRLLTGDFTFLNDRLARHYALPSPGTAFKRVSLSGGQRLGLLTQGSFLFVTSYPTRTSPVKRGKWVLEQLLCTSPPPPPPNVPSLVQDAMPTGSLRERMEEHRANPVCASCHTVMDPIGFSFEHYDAVGHYRDTDNGFAIDPAGMLPDGTTFSGPLELAPLITADERFARCAVQQLFTYALGRGTEAYDDDDITTITDAFVAGGYQHARPDRKPRALGRVRHAARPAGESAMIGYRKLSRRVFIGGAGAVLALPWLESALPRVARAQAMTAPTRFLGYYVPCGIRMEHWTPTKEGAAYDLPPILVPLAGVQAKLSVLTGLANLPARPDGPGDHASGTGAFLTCAHPFKTEGADIKNGISLDQRLANEVGGDTSLRSLQVGIDGGDSAGGCDSGYSCAYARNISWSGPSTPLPKLTDPRTVFDRLFAGFDATASQEEATRRLRQSSSLLDYALAEAKSLSMRMGKTDQHKLDEYMTGVRELELRLQMASQAPACDPGMQPDGDMAFPDRVKIMSDLMVLAFQCDVTRITTFMLGNATSNRNYGFIGANVNHHEASHHQMDPTKLNHLTTIATWEMEQFAYLLTKMQAVDEGGESLLDHSAVFLSSEIEDGDTHAHTNMPILLAGGASGNITPGRHVRYTDQSSVGKLFVSLLQAFGLSDTAFGDGQGPLPGLT